MTQYIFSVRDRVADVYGPPLFAASDAVCIRSIRAAAHGDESLMRYASADFDLYCIGEFDDASGTLIPHVPTLVASLTSILGGDSHVSDTVRPSQD